jgi:hypothetical protein
LKKLKIQIIVALTNLGQVLEVYGMILAVLNIIQENRNKTAKKRLKPLKSSGRAWRGA